MHGPQSQPQSEAVVLSSAWLKLLRWLVSASTLLEHLLHAPAQTPKSCRSISGCLGFCTSWTANDALLPECFWDGMDLHSGAAAIRSAAS